MKQEYLRYLQCLYCKANLSESGDGLACIGCREQYEIRDGIIKVPMEVSGDKEISIDKWDQSYRKTIASGAYRQELNEYKKRFFQDVYANITSEKGIDKDTVYLEIGCGAFLFGNLIADRASLIIGVDFSFSALQVAKRLLDENDIENYILIQGDILRMPLKDGTADLIYGGGVIEHFKDTQTCVNELYRVLRYGGVCLNSVPYLNIASLTYRQLWGNIPNVPVLKQMAEFIHITMLGKRHMIFGYELSFLGSTLKRIHRKAGFGKVTVGEFRVDLSFEFVPKVVRPLLVFLARNSRLFWPMIKVVGIKENTV